jgi:hypothetical protein
MRPGAPPRVPDLERLGEPGFQELAQLGCRLELWDGIEFLECGRERIRKTPDRPRPEFLVLVGLYVVDKISLWAQRFMWRPPRDAHRGRSRQTSAT